MEFLGLGYPNFANFGEVTDYFYGNRCEFAVLYCGESFQSNTGRYWLNIADFLLAVDKYKDMDKVMTKLTENLPKRNLTQEEQEREASESNATKKKKQVGFGDI